MKTFEIETAWSHYDNCTLSQSEYANNGHIALSVWCDDGPLADLTVNLDTTKKYPKNYGYVDTNNFPTATMLIYRLGIGTWTGTTGQSGWCEYPLYEFDLEKIKEYTEGE